MNFRAPAKSTAIDIDLTPLINIVFLMLIFFMLAGSLSQGDAIEAAQVDNASAIDDDLLTIVMSVDGSLSVDGKTLDRSALTLFLEVNKDAGKKIAIKPDSRLAAEKLLALTEQLRAVGFSQVTLIVETP